MHTSIDSLCATVNKRTGGTTVVPLVSRPAKIGEYIVVMDAADYRFDRRFDVGDILLVTKDDTNIIDQWIGRAVGFKNITHPDRPWHNRVIRNKDYLVLDGYKPLCECCGREK